MKIYKTGTTITVLENVKEIRMLKIDSTFYLHIYYFGSEKSVITFKKESECLIAFNTIADILSERGERNGKEKEN